ncbi:Lrp/AsnC family transcriptional regulator [Halosimplex pelagicum]|uniref:Lrp/AsnC family transcriptional regulator n=1 Tax=Halosimplex pelagicum TaxID=869886 RepID=A0A7D5TEI2_9EURY|nr:Lrp/AsnC family transcriptional regulator [Halosimplex pelagicum]QLH84753.1 Lrp/AsnC family transcriptional regulator [Halosimplex pelagicum]
MADLDELDFAVLYLLQEDARNTTPVDMAERLPVSAQTVRNRIDGLEAAGVVDGYEPVVDYRRAGFPLRISFTCTAPVERRADLADSALELPRVVSVDEFLSASENLRVLAVTDDSEAITDISERLVDLGLTIESERLLRRRAVRPYDGFAERSPSAETD